MNQNIQYVTCDKDLKERISSIWCKVPPKHWHLDDGFTLVALDKEKIVGYVSVYWRNLPSPLETSKEGFIDIIEVIPEYRRRGIAANLLHQAEELSKKEGCCQIRAWSSDDKVEAIPMWKSLKYDLCPATIHPNKKTVSGYFVVKPLR